MSLAAVSACATTKHPQAIVLADSIEKPYVTLSTSCKKSEVPEHCADGIVKAIEQSADLVKQVHELKLRLNAAEAHTRIDSWFYESQIAERQVRIDSLEQSRWIWGGCGVGLGAITTILLVLFVN